MQESRDASRRQPEPSCPAQGLFQGQEAQGGSNGGQRRFISGVLLGTDSTLMN